MNSMTKIAFLVIIMMGSDQVIDGKQHKTVQSGASKPIKYFQSATKDLRDYINCTDENAVITKYQTDVMPCLRDKWDPLPHPMQYNDRECCFQYERLCAKSVHFINECALKTDYEKQVLFEYNKIVDDCMQQGNTKVSGDICSKLSTNQVNDPKCVPKWVHCQLTDSLPVQTTGTPAMSPSHGTGGSPIQTTITPGMSPSAHTSGPPIQTTVTPGMSPSAQTSGPPIQTTVTPGMSPSAQTSGPPIQTTVTPGMSPSANTSGPPIQTTVTPSMSPSAHTSSPPIQTTVTPGMSPSDSTGGHTTSRPVTTTDRSHRGGARTLAINTHMMFAIISLLVFIVFIYI